MITKLFKKLNYKDQDTILAINYPDSFDAELSAMRSFAQITKKPDEVSSIEFVIAFGKTLEEVEDITNAVGPKLTLDAVYWFCYPKQSSKKYTCEFNRDTGWAVMGKYNLEGVRQVAIDEDWSALRFRNVKKIRKMTRNTDFALTAEGKKKTQNKK